MSRLLHGEVGSGKTLVALVTALRVIGAGHQVALMVPTEILARQHHREFEKWLLALGYEVGLLLGGNLDTAKKNILEKCRTGELKIVIGTQSLIQTDVEFLSLSYVILDEFHRFGVEQRSALTLKGNKPDLLLMSATPIPRTLSLSIFGNLDLSTLTGRPAGGTGRKSKLLFEAEREHAYQFLYDRIRRGEQAFVVFPAIDSTKRAEVKNLTDTYKKLKKDFFKAIPTGILHGEVLEADRLKVMNDFYEGRIKVLFATTVLEVGVDFPDATVMIIESADRFGLSQLHQLRGRVGRGEKAGFVYLIKYGVSDDEASKRLKRFCEIDDGFQLSELDLELRGPGDFFGTKQAGEWKLRVADLIKDYDILKQAREDAQSFILTINIESK
jgi:ATP-dependent DNA helicase RecG